MRTGQNLHTLQLEVVRDKKLQYIDIELEATTTKRESLEEARVKQKPLQDLVLSQRKLIEKKKKEKQEARISGTREQESRIDAELRQMKVQEVEYADEALQTLDNGILQLNTKIKQLEGLRDRTSQELKIQPIGLLPNYKFSPRDLFIAFVTRSIFESRSLDIICRHWAPGLDDDGGGENSTILDLQLVKVTVWRPRNGPRQAKRGKLCRDLTTRPAKEVFSIWGVSG